MLPHDRIRFHLLNARRCTPESAKRDIIVDLMARALIEARRSGHATEAVMMRRYGFTADEISRYGQAAIDAATRHWAKSGCALEEAA